MNHIIRRARPGDAAEIIEHITQCAETYRDKLMTEVDEITVTESEEADIIIHLGENDLFLVAETEGTIIGTLTMFQSKYKKSSHVASFGMAVQEGFTGLGVGKKLMSYMMDFAENNKVINKLELEVFETNRKAVSMYQSFGFSEEGKRQRHVRIDDAFIDVVIMGRSLN